MDNSTIYVVTGFKNLLNFLNNGVDMFTTREFKEIRTEKRRANDQTNFISDLNMRISIYYF